MMGKMATGLIIGGLIGVAGAEYVMMNNTTKKRLMKKGKQMVDKAEDTIEDISNDVW